MRWKQSLTPLSAMPGLKEELASKLRTHHITTTEELAGQIEASPKSVSELLQIDEAETLELGREALQASNPEIVKGMDEQRGHVHKMGARLGTPPKNARDN